MSLPTVLFVSVPTGIGGSTRSLATVMASIGGVRRVLVGPAGGRFVDLVRGQGGLDGHLPLVSSRWPRWPRRAWTTVRLAIHVVRHRRSIAAIHANGLKELSLSLPAAAIGRVRLVVWVHNFALPPSIRLLGPVWRFLLRRTDVRWTAVSALARDLVVDARLTSADRVTVVPNPIDPADVVAASRQPADAVRVAYLGAPRAYKGFDLVPAIVEGVEAHVHWLVFSHATDDDLAATWERLRSMDADGRLTLVGKRADVREAFARCDVVVCPSRLESFCRVAAEAMANGLPVVGSDLAPIRALLGDDGDGAAGLLFPTGDVVAAAEAVDRLATDASLRDRLGAAGRRRAAAFDPAAVAEQLRACYGV